MPSLLSCCCVLLLLSRDVAGSAGSNDPNNQKYLTGNMNGEIHKADRYRWDDGSGFPCSITGANFGEGDDLPDSTNCQGVWQTAYKWEEYQYTEMQGDPPAAVSKTGVKSKPSSEGWWEFYNMGMPPNLKWQLKPQYIDPSIKLALVWQDVSVSNLRQRWVTPTGEKVIHWLQYDMSSLSTGSHDLHGGRLGSDSWGRTFTGSCEYPLGYPSGRDFEKFTLYMYKDLRRNYIPDMAKFDDFYEIIKDQVVGECSFTAMSKEMSSKPVPPTGYIVTDSPVNNCDGRSGSDNLPRGRKRSTPCGSYGCRCEDGSQGMC